MLLTAQYVERVSTRVSASRIVCTTCGRSRRVVGPTNASITRSVSGPRMPPSIRRSEEHTSELQSLMRISYAVFCLKKKKIQRTTNQHTNKYKHKIKKTHKPTQKIYTKKT